LYLKEGYVIQNVSRAGVQTDRHDEANIHSYALYRNTPKTETCKLIYIGGLFT